jgi:hypothetical protein
MPARSLQLSKNNSASLREKTMPATTLYSLPKPKHQPMKTCARPFLAQWEFEHIKPVARANREEQARLLAEKCRDDAAKAGINKWALEIVAGGDLIRNMIGALNEAESKQIDQ